MERQLNDLDPIDWVKYREQSHQMLDDMIDYLQNIRNRPVWQPIPDVVRERFNGTLPHEPRDMRELHREFMDNVLPYSVGNCHPGFMGWVHGGGNAAAFAADILSSGLNANCGGRNHIPIELERQIVRWMKELFAFPENASGLFVTGTSMANFLAIQIAKNSLITNSRTDGLGIMGLKLIAYTSEEAHGCIAQAMALSGLGTNSLRKIKSDAMHRMDIQSLRETIANDRAAGLTPFYLCGTAGTVDVGAIDPLQDLAQIAEDEQLWFHIDGAFGALGMLSPTVATKLIGIELADSIAFDFHKWGQVQYDAGFILVRDGEKHKATFAAPVAYLGRETRGLAADSPWPCDFGPDLSRGFRALKTWFTIQNYGSVRIGEMISNTCELAQYLVSLIQSFPHKLELLASVELNIVCFRYIQRREAAGDTISIDSLDNKLSLINTLNRELVADLHEGGLVAPSSTTVRGRTAIRCAIVNHRISRVNIDVLISSVLKLGDDRWALTICN